MKRHAWGGFILCMLMGMAITFLGMSAHNHGATWEGGMFFGFACGFLVAALS